MTEPSHVHEEGADHEPVEGTNFSYHNRFVELKSWEVVGMYSYPTAARFVKVTNTAHTVAKERKMIEKNRSRTGLVTGYSKGTPISFGGDQPEGIKQHLYNGPKDRSHSHAQCKERSSTGKLKSVPLFWLSNGTID